MSGLKILDIIRASVRADGSEATPVLDQDFSDVGATEPTISANGRKVAFISDFKDLVPGDTNDLTDVYVKNLNTGTITRANTRADGSESKAGNPDQFAQDNVHFPKLSADGTKIAFTSGASDLVPNDTNGTTDLFVKDLVTGAIVRANTTAAGTQAVVGTLGIQIHDYALSSDGTKVAFVSSSPNLVPGDTNASNDVFVKDVRTGMITRASTDAAGVQGSGFAYHSISISADGRKVAFISDAADLVPHDTNNSLDAFVKDLSTGAIIRANTTATGSQVKGDISFSTSLSADGTKLAFTHTSSDLVMKDSDDTADVFLKDLSSGAVRRVSGDEPDDLGFELQDLSPDGNRIAYAAVDEFGLNASLYIKDLNSSREALVIERSPLQLTEFSGNGSKFVFADFKIFTTGDSNGERDVFVSTLARGSDRILKGTDKADFLKGGVGDDALYGRNGSDSLKGYSGNDRLEGGRGNDRLQGGLGDDILISGSGKDLLSGDAGDDLLKSGDGADRLVGGPGNDMLTGGRGPDVFIVDSAAASVAPGDVISDFSRSDGDHIDLSRVFAHRILPGTPVTFLAEEGTPFVDFSFVPAVRWESAGNDVVIEADSRGFGLADMRLTLLGVDSIIESDLWLG